MLNICIFFIIITFKGIHSQFDMDRENSECIDKFGNAKICTPPFINAAYLRKVKASNTCGLKRPEQFCVQSGASGFKTVCDICDNSDINKRHPPDYVTDYNYIDQKTWWQSQTLNEFKDLEKMEVNLTLNLGTQFKITYISIIFKTPRPASLVILKKFNDSSPWTEMQQFSSSCEAMFKKIADKPIQTEDEVQCVSKYSTLAPLSGGSVIFSTLEGRPGSENFLNNQVLKDFVTGSQIRIYLKRLNPFGDEIFGDERVLKTYFYAISDISIGGRCNCNGHASSCTLSTGDGLDEAKLYCNCEHNTEGQNCQRCRRGYHDKPWQSATIEDTHECKKCNCNGHSDACYFDEELYKYSGKTSGGHCINCKDNTEGAHCERCKLGHYKPIGSNNCVPCNCDPVAPCNPPSPMLMCILILTGTVRYHCSLHGKCTYNGNCLCKRGVTGAKCNRCADGYHDFGPGGCKSCSCKVEGSEGNKPSCDANSGVCRCKENVEGKTCERCLPGYFGMSSNDPLGCQPCFCYGHSSECSAVPNQYVIDKKLPLTSKDWKIVDQDGKEYPVLYKGRTSVMPHLPPFLTPVVQWKEPQLMLILFYSVPPEFLGDQSRSYNQFIKFNISFDSVRDVVPTYMDLVIQSGKQEISIPLSSQGNPTPVLNKLLVYRFRLNENNYYRWESPNLSNLEMMGILSNITAIKIRATYRDIFYGNETGRARLHQFALGTVTLNSALGGKPTHTLEQCVCPKGHTGQRCEKCQPNYRHESPGPYSRCIPCECNGHAATCDGETGKCECKDNTAGLMCDKCKSGYYGNATNGTPNDCKKCPCPLNGPCMQDYTTKQVVCLGCPSGHAGALCDRCVDGFYGQPPSTLCKPCNCNGNIDPNEVGVCDPITGECLRCAYNTAGPRCSKCQLGYYGNALATPKGQCRSCNCNPKGTYRNEDGQLTCDGTTGQCLCLMNVRGEKCDECKRGYYGLSSGKGCAPCNCMPMGSLSPVCDPTNGQCQCKDGVNERDCSKCKALHYNMTSIEWANGTASNKGHRKGCTPCQCSPIGSISPQCAPNGQCKCRKFVEGINCDQCVRDRFNIAKGCLKCPPCYDVIARRVDEHDARLKALMAFITKKGAGIGSSTLNKSQFEPRITKLKKEVDDLLKVLSGIGKTGDIDQIKELKRVIGEIIDDMGILVANKRSIDAENKSPTMKCPYDPISKDILDILQEVAKVLTYLKKEGADALKEAKKHVVKSSQQDKDMQGLAKISRDALERQMKKVKELSKLLADLEKNVTKLEQDVKGVRPVVLSFDKKIKDMEDMHKETQMIADTIAKMMESLPKMVETVHEKALDLVRRAKNLIPRNADVDNLKKELEEIKKNAEDLADLAKALGNQRAKRQSVLLTKLKAAMDQLEKAKKQQKSLEDMAKALAELKKQADTIKDETNALYKKGQEINKTLEKYDKMVDEWKKKAKDAVTKVPGIQKKIADDNKELASARSQLDSAKTDTDSAAKNADDAKKKATTTGEDALKTQEQVQKLQRKTSLDAFRQEANSKKVEAITEKLDQDKKKLDEEGDRTKFASGESASAKEKADSLTKGVEKSLKTVDDILKELNSVNSLNPLKLTELENRVKAIENSMDTGKVEERIGKIQNDSKTINEAAAKLFQDLVSYSREKEILQTVLKNMAGKGCYKVGASVET